MDDISLLRFSLEIAQKFSTDPSTQNGAVLVEEGGFDRRIVCSSANFFPKNVNETEERWQRPLKYSFVEHAERNVIFEAARNGFKTYDLTMFCGWYACADCARAIVQAGIREVVGLSAMDNTNERWNASVEVGNTILDEGGVIRRYIKLEKPFGIKLRRDGQLVEF